MPKHWLPVSWRLMQSMPPVSDGCADEIAKNWVWVAEEEGQIIGGLFLVRQVGALKLANVAVHPDHSGKGLG
jgi:predicted N-acetyltransferase YhbS